MLSPIEIHTTYKRIQFYLHETPILESTFLNQKYGHRLLFKYEGMQRIGAFKFRGAINALLSYQERHGTLPEKVVAFSSGNHAQAVALACQILNVQARIYIPKVSSKTKILATKSYGAEVILSESRTNAENAVRQDAGNGYHLIHPFDDADVLLGQGTSCYEALHTLKAQNITPDAIFATCGGGGWLAGSYLAKELVSPSSRMFGAEPAAADDAYRSLQAGRILSLSQPSMTIADGARSTCVGNITFEYLKKLDGFYTILEEDIIYHTQWLNHILKVRVEPTSAVTMGGVAQYVASQPTDKQQVILILLSGGNIDAATERKIWETDYL